MDQGFNGLENEMAKGNDKTTPLQKMDNAAVCRRKLNMKVAQFEMGTTYLEPIFTYVFKIQFQRAESIVKYVHTVNTYLIHN